MIRTVAAQRSHALSLANEVRFARKDAKRRLKNGELSIGDALVLPEMANVLAWDLVGEVRGFGSGNAGGLETAMRRLFRQVKVAEWAQVGSLTVRQRAGLVAGLEEGFGCRTP